LAVVGASRHVTVALYTPACAAVETAHG
jgi:hypothetical protein